jgi:hypothetical protein
MRRFLVALTLLPLVGGLLPAGALTPGAAPIAGVVSRIGPGYVATDNVEWLGTIPFNAGSAGSVIHDGRLYVTDDRGLTIYDVSDPTAPRPLGFALVPQSPYVVEEDPETNGEILLISSYTDATRSLPGPLSVLYVVDVRDPTRPYIRSQLQGAQQHTWSCVLDCSWGYGNAGVIADLRDVDAPRRSPVDWWSATRAQLDALGIDVRQSQPHDVTEVAPGFVAVSANPVVLLDVREDPEDPRVVAVGELPDRRFVHGNLWPNEATDAKLLVGGETSGDCASEDSGAFMTMDAGDVDLSEAALDDHAAAGTVQRFTLLDEHRVFTGIYTDGDSPYNQFCAHWFTAHPSFDGAGLVAMGWYEHGVRFLDVADDGAIDEAGWFVPLGGSTSAAYWVSEDVVYTSDYQRGIDILRFTGDPAAGERRVEGPLPALPAVRPTRVLPPAALGIELLCPLPGL